MARDETHSVLVGLDKTVPSFMRALLSTWWCMSCAGLLQVLSGVDERHKDAVASEVHHALMLLMGGTINNWRCQAHLAAALPALPGLLNADVLADQWMPYTFNLLLSGELSWHA